MRLGITFRNTFGFSNDNMQVSPSSSKSWGPFFIGCSQLIIRYILHYPPYLEVTPSIRNLRIRNAMAIGDLLDKQNLTFFRHEYEHYIRLNIIFSCVGRIQNLIFRIRIALIVSVLRVNTSSNRRIQVHEVNSEISSNRKAINVERDCWGINRSNEFVFDWAHDDTLTWFLPTIALWPTELSNLPTPVAVSRRRAPGFESGLFL